LVANRDLLDVLVALRGLGPEGADALAAVLDIKRVATMRLSVALWSELVTDDGNDPDALLAALLPDHVVCGLRGAIGDGARDAGAARLRVVIGPE